MTSPAWALFASAAITTTYQSTFGLLSYFLKTDVLTDLAGTSNFLRLALRSYFSSTRSSRQALITVCVSTWAARLGIFLLRRILRWGHDRRISGLRATPVGHATLWAVQALWVWVVSFPVVLANASDEPAPLALSDLASAALFVTGLATEAIADFQKLRFTSRDPTKWMHTGLWRYSRHPNYFGEIVLWTAIYLLAAPALNGLQHAAVISPLFTAALLIFCSGIPLIERSADKKYANNPNYVQYKSKTSVLIPMPPAVYSRFPLWFKKSFLFDYDMFNHIHKFASRQHQRNQ